MLNQLITLDRPLFILDCETTSTDVQQARIIELAFQRWESSGMTKEWSARLNPCVPIPANSTKIHGITDADVIGRPTFKQIASNIASGFSNCSFGGQNCRFDLQILYHEMRRVGQPWSYEGARIVDSARLEALLHPRDLSSLHEKYVGHKHDGAHGALSDVRAAATVIAHQLQRDGLPKDLAALHEAQWPGWLTCGGEFRLVDGVATVAFGKHKGKAVADVPNDYWDWLLGAEFPEDVKRVARKAKMGKFYG